jgi:hypothetical protein
VNRLDQETAKEARAHKGCRGIQEEEEEWLLPFSSEHFVLPSAV